MNSLTDICRIGRIPILLGVAAGLTCVSLHAQCLYTQITDPTLTVIGNSQPGPMPTGSTITNTLAYNITASGNYITQSVAQIAVVSGKVSVCLPGAAVYQMQYNVTSPYPLSGSTQYNRVWTIPAPTSSIVNTSSGGNTVSWVSGATFVNLLTGNTVVIAGTSCTISAPCLVATVPSSVSLTLTSNPGTHSGAALTSNGPYLISQIESSTGSPPAAFSVAPPLTFSNQVLGIQAAPALSAANMTNFPPPTPGLGITWTSGAGAPSNPCVGGSLYSNSTGTAGSTLYDCVGTSWHALSSPN